MHYVCNDLKSKISHAMSSINYQSFKFRHRLTPYVRYNDAFAIVTNRVVNQSLNRVKTVVKPSAGLRIIPYDSGSVIQDHTSIEDGGRS